MFQNWSNNFEQALQTQLVNQLVNRLVTTCLQSLLQLFGQHNNIVILLECRHNFLMCAVHTFCPAVKFPTSTAVHQSVEERGVREEKQIREKLTNDLRVNVKGRDEVVDGLKYLNNYFGTFQFVSISTVVVFQLLKWIGVQYEWQSDVKNLKIEVLISSREQNERSREQNERSREQNK